MQARGGRAALGSVFERLQRRYEGMTLVLA